MFIIHITLMGEIFAGRNFSEFRELFENSQKLILAKINPREIFLKDHFAIFSLRREKVLPAKVFPFSQGFSFHFIFRVHCNKSECKEDAI